MVEKRLDGQPVSGPHQGEAVRHAGVALEGALAAMILVHGRGSSADAILTLRHELDEEGYAFLAPQAAGNTWYPLSFLAPMARNEPGISSGLQALADVVATVEAAAIPAERIILLGFSQGACLTTEFVARRPRRYGGVVALSGGLIGPPGTPRDYPGSLDGAPVFLGCSDMDSHIPVERVHESSAVFRQMGGVVTERIYPGMGHTVNRDEIDFVRELMTQVRGASPAG